MDLFNEQENARNSLEQICDAEDNINFMLIVSMVSMLNKKFYSPVAFFIEYVTNKNIQKMIENITGYEYHGFIIIYLRNFPNVAKSRKLKRIIDERNDTQK